jgi:hypothetical protein
MIKQARYILNYISERIIEDIFTIDKSILAEILSINSSDMSLVSRQKKLKSGNLDLLYLYNDELILVELKVVPFYNKIINQINSYHKDLLELQSKNKLIRGNIKKYILVTASTKSNQISGDINSVQIINYNPDDVLKKFYENFKEISKFLKIQSGDYGVVRLSLLQSTLNNISKGMSLKQICITEKKSLKTIKNRLSVATLLNLVSKHKGNYFLTELGVCFDNLYEENRDFLNQSQKELLQNFLKENPFYSSITYTIFSIVESIFILSKNSYPVPFNDIKEYFIRSVGKSSTWKTTRARQTATYIFSNYACELDLLIKINNNFYLSPTGIQFVLLLQLNRAIKLIDSQR